MTGLKILLVDDHTDTLSVLSRLLRRVGHDVSTADTARQARTLVDQHPFDLLLVDLGLPDQDGRDLIRSIRPRCVAPAIALTGFGMEADAESCSAAGFAKHLVKPISFDALLAAVGELNLPVPSPGTP